ncbi:MAG: hypothetical protein AMJ53_01115 [Gammaproteobacteria bacterium SG8_11]|nr:MAG: hypothetical protein AMJ53_01115 [Gammaproteobacteria bacterium SG8_11]
MVSLTMKHSISWRAPMPLWAENSSTGIRVINEDIAPQPSILRFATDTFMDDMLSLLQENPKRIAEWVAQPETWRSPMPAPRLTKKPADESSVAYLINRTKQLAEKQKPGTGKLLTHPKQSVVVPRNENSEALPLKLFQSAHQRFYLVSASLIDRQPGLPDRVLDLVRNEKVSFVVRRLVPPDSNTDTSTANQTIDNIDEWDEYAFVLTSRGGKWQRIDQYNKATTKKLIPQEEQLPMFPVNYKDSCNHNRSLHSGLIPVGKREAWMGAPADDSVNSGQAEGETEVIQENASQAKISFQTDVSEPWKILVEQAQFKNENMARSFDNIDAGGGKSGEDERALRTARDNIQTASWYVLLDFAKFLQQYLPNLWEVANGRATTDILSEDETSLLNAINTTTVSNALIDSLVKIKDQYLTNDTLNITLRRQAALVKRSLMDALVAILDLEDNLESVDNEFVRFDEDDKPLTIDPKWPSFLFPLADPEHQEPLPPEIPGVDYPEITDPSDTLDYDLALIDALADLVGKILPAPPETEELFSSQPVLDQKEAWFVVRCVYERPNCGPLFPALVSHPTRAFQMAPFFDPDAPARPVRIPMPVDISPAGLRKYKKNTAFIISDMLCGKIKKIRKITLGDLVLSVLPWPFHKDLPNPGKTGPCKKGGISFGMICSLSIPIITLCALILLMIMVALFDLFFRWIPFLFVCLPIPGLKGKKG